MTNRTSNKPTVVRTGRGLSISGTRITLYSVMDFVKAGWPAKLIRDRLNLTDAQIDDVLTYIDAHRDEVEAEYRQVAKEADETRHYWEEKYLERMGAVQPAAPKPEEAALRAKLAAAKAKLNGT